MPVRDLRTDDGPLNPLAPFIVLGLMCYPRQEDQQYRARMLSTLRAQTGVGKPRVRKLTADQFFQKVGYHVPRAAVSGFLLMTCVQLHELGEDHSLEAAIALASPLPDRWANKLWPVYDKLDQLTHMPHSRRKMRDAFNRYLPVAHLWAAFLHGVQNERPNIAPTDNTTLPTFLAYGEAFAEKAGKVPFRSPNRRILVPNDLRWQFLLPDELIKKVRIGALPADWISHPATP